MSDETTVGREPIQIVELEQPACNERYDVPPCTATLGDTGSRKCFNTTKTCQDRPNYDQSFTFFWRFAKPQAVLPRDLYDESAGVHIKTNPIPSLLSVSTTPTKINVGGGSRDASPFGRRSTVSITLQDHLWDDSVNDFYVTERPTGDAGDVYTPIDRGTFWTKWLNRNPFHSGYLVRVYDGYKGQSLGSMQVRLYILERINGPTGDKVTLIAKDPLRLSDKERAQFPAVTDATLVSTIVAGDTAGIEFAALETELNSNFGNTGSTRYIRIGDEIITYTGYVNSGTNEWTLNAGVVRGSLGTIADGHDADDKAQRVGRYSAFDVWEIAEDLLTNHTNVDPAFIDGTAWDTEGNSFLAPFSLTGTVAEPTPVEELLSELTEQCPFYMWWDERNQTIPIKAIRPPIGDSIGTLDDTTGIIRDSSILKQDPSQRISRVFLYYNRIDPTKAMNETGNFSSLRLRVDPDAEDTDEYGEVRIREIFSRWLTSSAQAIQTTTRLLARFRNSVESLVVKVDAKDRSISTADVLEITTRTVVDDTGEPVTAQWQAVSVNEVVQGEVMQIEFQRFEYLGRFWLWADEAAPDYSAATDQEKEDNAFYSDDDGSPGDDSGVPAFGYQWV